MMIYHNCDESHQFFTMATNMVNFLHNSNKSDQFFHNDEQSNQFFIMTNLINFQKQRLINDDIRTFTTEKQGNGSLPSSGLLQECSQKNRG